MKIRTLIRVEKINGDTMDIAVPAWNWNQTITVPLLEGIIFPWREGAKYGYCYAKADLEAETVEDLDISNWEPSQLGIGIK